MGPTTAVMTVNEFLKLPELDGGKLELFHGEVVSTAYAGFVPELVKANLIALLAVWLSQYRIGKTFAETTYRLGGHECLAPGISVLRNDRLSPVTQDLPPGAPDLAIEVVSSETAARLRAKIALYLRHGSKTVWAVYPEQRMMEIHRANGQITKLESHQVLEGYDALPGFTTPVSAIFEGLEPHDTVNET